MWAAVWLVLAELLFKFSFLIVRKARGVRRIGRELDAAIVRVF